MLYKTVCRLSCNEGFEAKGSILRRCTENGTWTGIDFVCEGIYTNGLTLKPADREPNALLKIFGKIIDLPKPSNLKIKTIRDFSRALDRGTGNMFSCISQAYVFDNIRYTAVIPMFCPVTCFPALPPKWLLFICCCLRMGWCRNNFKNIQCVVRHGKDFGKRK